MTHLQTWKATSRRKTRSPAKKPAPPSSRSTGSSTNRSASTPRRAYAILGTSFGITIAGTIIGWKYWWVLFLLLAVACIALAIWDNNRNVRPSMKQPLQEDPKTNWAAALAPMPVSYTHLTLPTKA